MRNSYIPSPMEAVAGPLYQNQFGSVILCNDMESLKRAYS